MAPERLLPDVAMPGVDGLELQRQLTELARMAERLGIAAPQAER